MKNDFLRRTWAEIDLDALEYNIRQIRGLLKPDCKLLSVVKADAYGHGQHYAARSIDRSGADWFGVSNLEEALLLRESGIEKPVLIFGITPVEHAAILKRENLTQTIVSPEYAAELSQAAARLGETLDVHIKLDTGMGRAGLLCGEVPDLNSVAAVCRMQSLHASGIYTHFSSTDDPSPESESYTRLQFARFCSALVGLEKAGIRFELAHCCNSGGVLRYPEMHLDMVRPGLIQFGLYPDDFRPVALKSAMQLRSAVSLVKDIPAGSAVSYGRTFVAERPMTIAIVSIGYADGYCRSLSGRGCMLVRGQKAPIVGRVCMDLTVLDVTGIDGVREGDIATVFGCDGEANLPAEAVAELAGTIHYEVICKVGRRVPRGYYSGGERIGTSNYLHMDLPIL